MIKLFFEVIFELAGMVIISILQVIGELMIGLFYLMFYVFVFVMFVYALRLIIRELRKRGKKYGCYNKNG